METQYLQLNYKTGNFFHKIKEAKEGYEHTVTEFDGKRFESYRKEYNRPLKGTLTSVGVNAQKFGTSITLSIRDEENGVTYVPQVNLHDKWKNIAGDYTESLIRKLPNLNKGDQVEFGAYKFTPDDSKYERRGVYFKVNGEKVKDAIFPSYYKEGELVENEIPAVRWEKKAFGDGMEPNAQDQIERNKYLEQFLKKEIDRLEYKKGEENPVETEKEIKPVSPEEAFGVGEEDDLPF